nr:deSI-like protein At4g17486 isoform X2 [Lepeophtheirus salmonis]
MNCFSDIQNDVENEDEEIEETTNAIFLSIYSLKNNALRFYHTGIQFHNTEYTFCYGVGIVKHSPQICQWAQHLENIYLGQVNMSQEEFEELLNIISRNGFSPSNYNVMNRSCNNFTHHVALKLGLEEKYSNGVMRQIRMGEWMARMHKIH